MKKIKLLTLLLIVTFGAFSQTTMNFKIISSMSWSDPGSFKLSPRPHIKGYGYYSDSLSKMFDGKTFYEHNDEYYCIESWADYYYWFTKEYSHLFNEPGLYSFYYWANDNYGMASFIASDRYLGKFYPSRIGIEFEDKNVKENRLADNKYCTGKDIVIEDFQNKNNEETETNSTTLDNKKEDVSPKVFNKDQFRERIYTKPVSTERSDSRISKGSSTKPIKK